MQIKSFLYILYDNNKSNSMIGLDNSKEVRPMLLSFVCIAKLILFVFQFASQLNIEFGLGLLVLVNIV